MHWWVAQGIDENQNKRFLQMSDFWQPPAPQPQVHTLHRWVAQTGHLWQQLRIQPRHNQALPFYLKICKSTLFIDSNLDVWDHTATHLYLQWIAIWQIFLFSFLNFFPFCAAAADSVDYFLVLIFLCTAWLLLITGGSSNRLCPISNRVCKAVSSIFSDFCFQYFFFPGTFTGG